MTQVSETPALADAAPIAAESGGVSAKAKTPRTFGKRVCPECAAVFVAKHHAAMFCQPAHQRAFHARNMARGKVAVPYVAAWRTSRNNRKDRVVGKFAFGQLCRMADQWAAEDRDAGRPTVIDYMRLRMRTEAPELTREDREAMKGVKPVKTKPK